MIRVIIRTKEVPYPTGTSGGSGLIFFPLTICSYIYWTITIGIGIYRRTAGSNTCIHIVTTILQIVACTGSKLKQVQLAKFSTIAHLGSIGRATINTFVNILKSWIEIYIVIICCIGDGIVCHIDITIVRLCRSSNRCLSIFQGIGVTRYIKIAYHPIFIATIGICGILDEGTAPFLRNSKFT